MSAYGTLDQAFPGLKYGLESRVASKTVKETNGIDFGMPLFGYEGNDNDVYLFKNDSSQTVFDADFVTSNSIVATVNGTAVTAVPFDTDHDTTMTNLKTQIEADITGATATLTDTGGDNRTIVIDIDGVDVVVTWSVTGGASQAGDTVTVDSRQIFVGLSLFTQLDAAEKQDLAGSVVTAATAKYALSDAANVLIDGWMYVAIKDNVSAKKATYVITTGANKGYCTDETSGNDALAGVSFENNGTAANGYALVRVNK